MTLDPDRDYVTNPRGHQWKTDEEGKIDFFVMEAEFHNGPMCVKCGFTFCEHCDQPITTCTVSDEGDSNALAE